MNVRRLERRWINTTLILTGVVFVVVFVLHRTILRQLRGVPPRISFTSDKQEDWRAYGGAWEIGDGTVQNASDERGAKLIAGSPEWSDYVLESDIQISGSQGDAGVIVRVADEEEGVDSYHGYYIGLTTQPYKLPQTDNLLIIGKADHSYYEIVQASVPAGVIPFHWYHLKVLADGCWIVASVSDSNRLAPAAIISTEDRGCFRSGKIGLRSYATGASWRNIVIRPATPADRSAMLALQRIAGTTLNQHAPAIQKRDVAPLPQADVHGEQQNVAIEPGEEKDVANVQPIGDLRLAYKPHSSQATVRGIVTATAPSLFIQDSNSGLQVLQRDNRSFNIGDDVQVTGIVQSSPTKVSLRDAKVDLLWAGAPSQPLSMTATQAAAGALNPTLVQVKGRLLRKAHGTDKSLILTLGDGQQNFLALMTGERAALAFDRLRVGSLLTLSGICTADARYTQNSVPFVLLLRSLDDIDVIAGPPWWNKGHIILTLLISLLTLLSVQYLYARVERWRLRAVLEERERLAHEMHDTLAQSFAGIGFQLQAVQSELSNASSRISGHVDLASTLVRQSHDEARRCIAMLRPEALRQLGLLKALERSAARMVEGGSVQVEISSSGTPQVLPVLISDTLFRIGQEGIANAVRHASASTIAVRLIYGKNDVELSIKDDGGGFDTTSRGAGFGLRGMHKRAELISAGLIIRSAPGKGTLIRVNAPLPPELSLLTFPFYIWKYLKEHAAYARDTSLTDDQHPHRG